MPLRAMVTPLSLYSLDNTIFDGIVLPTRPSNPTDYPDLYVEGFNLDRDVLIENLLLETGELDVIYPDPSFFKFAVTAWSKKELPVWQELYNTLFYKYNPLWNKDGTVKETAEQTRDLANESTLTKTTDMTRTEDLGEDILDTDDNLQTRNLTDTNSGTLTTRDQIDEDSTNTSTKTNTGTQTDQKNSTTEVKVSAYDASTYQNRDQTTINETDTRTDNLTEQITGGDTRDADNLSTVTDSRSTAYTGTDRNERDYHRVRSNDNTISDEGTITDRTEGTDTGTVTNELTRKEFGNIGVTMTTALIQAQRDLVKLNFYDLIIDSFKERFCILVY